MEGIPGNAVADDFGVDFCIASQRVPEFLDDDDPGSLADHKPVPVFVERA